MSSTAFQHSALPRSENTYIIEDGNATDMARLINQASLLTQATGGLFPERDDLFGITHILDLGCGPGGWVLEVAGQYPTIQVTGVDLSPTMIEYARAHAHARGYDNAHFQEMNILHPFKQPDASFDLINGRFLSSFLPTTAWPGVIAECLRVLRPGGILRLTEGERAMTTSEACEQFSRNVAQAMKYEGHSFSPTGDTLCVTPMLGRFLHNAGCRYIQKHPLLLDYSIGEGLHRSFFENNTTLLYLLEPLLLKHHLTTPQELEDLRREVAVEMLAEGFQAIWFLLTVSGQKPSIHVDQDAGNDERGSSDLTERQG